MQLLVFALYFKNNLILHFFERYGTKNILNILYYQFYILFVDFINLLRVFLFNVCQAKMGKKFFKVAMNTLYFSCFQIIPESNDLWSTFFLTTQLDPFFFECQRFQHSCYFAGYLQFVYFLTDLSLFTILYLSFSLKYCE